MNNKQLETYIKKRNLDIELSKIKDEILNGNNRLDLNISRHFLERLVERKLYDNINYITAMIKWFMQNVYYKTSYVEKNYLLSCRGLNIGISIHDRYVSKCRQAVVKTIYEFDSDKFEYHEMINMDKRIR